MRLVLGSTQAHHVAVPLAAVTVVHAVDGHRQHEPAGVVGVVADEVDPARARATTSHGRQAEAAGEALERVEVERGAQREVDLVGAGVDVAADAVDDLGRRSR